MTFLIVCLYFLPTIVALVQRGRDSGTAIVVNLFLGWTLVGWVVALAMACRSREQSISMSSQTVFVTRAANAMLPPTQPMPPLGGIATLLLRLRSKGSGTG